MPQQIDPAGFALSQQFAQAVGQAMQNAYKIREQAKKDKVEQARWEDQKRATDARFRLQARGEWMKIHRDLTGQRAQLESDIRIRRGIATDQPLPPDALDEINETMRGEIEQVNQAFGRDFEDMGLAGFNPETYLFKTKPPEPVPVPTGKRDGKTFFESTPTEVGRKAVEALGPFDRDEFLGKFERGQRGTIGGMSQDVIDALTLNAFRPEQPGLGMLADYIQETEREEKRRSGRRIQDIFRQTSPEVFPPEYLEPYPPDYLGDRGSFP